MKKLLFTFAVGALLASCSANQDKEAAADYCACFEMAEETSEAAGDSQSFTEMMEAVNETKAKMTECMEAWKTKYEGKITKEGFAEEVKKKNPEVYEMAEKQGVFDF